MWSGVSAWAYVWVDSVIAERKNVRPMSVQQADDVKACVVDAIVNTDAIIRRASQTQLIIQLTLLGVVSYFA